MKHNFLKIAHNTKSIHDIICRCHDPEPLTLLCDEYTKKYIGSIYGKINCDGIPGSNSETQSRATKYFLMMEFECHDEMSFEHSPDCQFETKVSSLQTKTKTGEF